MAGQPINLTRSVTTITPQSGTTFAWQPTSETLDVTGFPGARFDFSLKVYVINGTPTPTVTGKLYTSMYNDDNTDGWKLLGSAFTAVTASNTTQVISVTSNVLRYVKWKIEYSDVTLVTFEILGVAW